MKRVKSRTQSGTRGAAVLSKSMITLCYHLRVATPAGPPYISHINLLATWNRSKARPERQAPRCKWHPRPASRRP